MLDGVKIVNSRDPQTLSERILDLSQEGYELVGPVTVAVTLANDLRYVATLVHINKEKQ